jgi:uncharacterized membrane protein YfcA
MDTEPAPKKSAMLGLLIQVAVIGGVAGYLITSPEPWAKYGFLALFLFLAGKMIRDFKQVKQDDK